MRTSVHRRLDARSLIGIAHPLRIRIRDHLRRVGPGTATQLARELGESSGATSYHLRMLARHGFVEPDPGHEKKGRERWWRATSEVIQIHPSEFLDDGVAREALRVVTEERRRLNEQRLEKWLNERERWSAPWRDAAEDSVYVARLSPERARALADELITIIEAAYAESADPADPDPGTRGVEIQLNVFPTGDPA
jgi:DNA-binding transcriptional ArsR family regulator